MMINRRFWVIFFLALLSSAAPCNGQGRDDDVVRIRTRVVFIDTLVKDKKTGALVSDLTRENFEVRDDGKPRALSYFSRAGEGRRRPLALVLVLNLAAGDSQDDLRRAGIIESLTAALKKLSPEDEVAIVARLGGEGAPLKTLTDFTRDPAKMAEALAAVQSLPKPQAEWYDEELGNVLQQVELAAGERRDSQIIVVPLTHVLQPISISKRDKIAARLIRVNALFSPLICDRGKASISMRHVPGKLPVPPRPIFDAIGRLAGVDNYAPQHIAQATGGEAASACQPEDYGAALEKIIGALAARYNLGFALAENEKDDGHMHRLEVRAKARDSRGKQRNLVVMARRGYYLKPKEVPAKK